MKKLLIAALAAAFSIGLCGYALADNQTPATQPHKHHLAQLLKALNLTADQKTQVKAIVQAARAASKNAANKQAKHEIWKAAIENIKKNVLTAAQRQQLEQMIGNFKAHHNKTA